MSEMAEVTPLRPQSQALPDAEVALDALLTREQLARFLAVHTNTVDRLVRDGKLSAYHFGRNVRFRLRDIEAFLDEHRWERASA
jgi:excisionase family DNA binding protein